MGRKSKFSKETTRKLVKFIRDGFTISDACYGAGISVATFNRWRNMNPDFDKAIHEATSRQWESSLALAQYGCRKYQRRFIRADKYPTEAEKPPTGATNGSQRAFYGEGQPSQSLSPCGLPVGDMYKPVARPNQRYYDPKMDKVFWRDDSGVLTSMNLAIWERQYYQRGSDPFLGCVF